MKAGNDPENIDQSLSKDSRARFRFASSGFSMQETEQAIHQRFEKQVAKYGNRVAVKTKDLEWTYDDLNSRANRISRSISANCRSGTAPAALLFENDAAAVSAMIGALKSGNVYVPIGASNPLARIRSMIKDAGVGLIVMHNQTIRQAHALSGGNLRLLNIDEIDNSVSGVNSHNSVLPDSFACMLYTSGSTGQPKGVLQTHRNILHQVYDYTNKTGIASSDRLSLLPSFDVGAGHLDIYSALLNGASLYPCSIKEEGFQQLTEWFIKERLTVYHSVPTLFRHLASQLPEGVLFPDLRVVNLGGERVSIRDFELFRKHFSRGSVFMNSLACTEAGPFSQYFADHDSYFDQGLVPAGYPAEETGILLIDEQGNLVCGDGIGEILIKSRYLSPGYWQNPELTGAAFKSCSGEQGLRVYSTGDLGRVRRDGMLDYLGRKDFQVKINGYRVETTEIELALQKHPSIKDAAVLGHDNPSGKKQLTAYVVSYQGEYIPSGVLRAYLREILPDYMIPSIFVFLESLPMTPNGKLDQNALRAISTAEKGPEDLLTIPGHPVERKLIDVWRDLLKTKNIKVTDNFFDLGGDSLASIDLFCWIEKEFGKRISPSAIYKWPTVEQLAAIITENPGPEPASCLIPIKPEGAGPPLIVIPSILSDSLAFLDVISYLDHDHPVYGLEMSDRDLDNPINEVTDHYVDQIMKTFPAGPFYLIGYSSGGIMALEIARRLCGLNRNVSFLAMVDTIFPASPGRQLTQFGKVSPSFFFRNLPYWLYYFLPFWTNYYIRLAKNRNFRSFSKTAQNRVLAVRHWLRHYRPEPYSGRVAFYMAKAQGLCTGSSYKGWENICSGLDIYALPGCHNTMMNKLYGRFIAEKLNSELHKPDQGL